MRSQCVPAIDRHLPPGSVMNSLLSAAVKGMHVMGTWLITAICIALTMKMGDSQACEPMSHV